MTTHVLEQLQPRAGGDAVVVQIAACVEELAVLAGRGCLVESALGRLVAHELPCGTDVTPIVVNALVGCELSGMHAALTRRRSTGVLPTGAVIQGLLADGSVPVAYLPLRDAGEPVGGVWLLLDEPGLNLDRLRAPVLRLASLLACTAGGDEVQAALAACLTGDETARLPNPLRDRPRLWVAAVHFGPEVATDAALRALSIGCGAASERTVRVCAAQSGDRPYVVIGADRTTSDAHALRVLEQLVATASGRLGQPLSAGLSDPCDATGLVVARQQGDAAADAAGIGRCVTLSAVRPSVLLRHLAQAIDSLPDLGRDPLAALDDYDRRRGADFAQSLLAYLDAFGDVAGAASVLDMHENTLRYRLKRIQEITGVDLRHDPPGRLDLHLRLHARRFR
jgi:hypothetical protein